MTDLPAPRAVAVVRDLFWSARIRETARLAGRPVVIARSPEDLRAALDEAPAALAIVDLTAGDPDAVLAVLDARRPRPPVLGFTTHALARETQPHHARCDRVVTKETLTQELGGILASGRVREPDAEPGRARDAAP
jgi:hypothetical protein